MEWLKIFCCKNKICYFFFFFFFWLRLFHFVQFSFFLLFSLSHSIFDYLLSTMFRSAEKKKGKLSSSKSRLKVEKIGYRGMERKEWRAEEEKEGGGVEGRVDGIVFIEMPNNIKSARFQQHTFIDKIFSFSLLLFFGDCVF